MLSLSHKIEEQDRHGGINIEDVEHGASLRIHTINSEYHIRKINDHQMTIQGGRWPEITNMIFHGSTWGGSIMKTKWIGFKMHMEFTIEGKRYVTSPVVAATVIGEKSRWQYSLEWPTIFP